MVVSLWIPLPPLWRRAPAQRRSTSRTRPPCSSCQEGRDTSTSGSVRNEFPTLHRYAWDPQLLELYILLNLTTKIQQTWQRQWNCMDFYSSPIDVITTLKFHFFRENIICLLFSYRISIVGFDRHISVDDGSDQDYDSHIMVWQLPRVSPGAPAADANAIPQSKLPPLLSPTGSSMTSSSVDLGPTPGSGVVTVDSSDERDPAVSPGLPDSFVEEATEETAGGDSYSNWNKDVESLMNNALEAGKLESLTEVGQEVMEEEDLTLTTGRRSRSSVVPSPKEDFTQQMNPN